MSTGEITALAAIIFVFATFGVTLFSVTWYCERAEPRRGAGTAHPTDAHFTTDD
jgi:hypothetical protein